MKPVFAVLVLFTLLMPWIAEAAISQSLQEADSLRVGDVFTLRLDADYPIERVVLPDSLTEFSVIGSKALGKDRYSWQMKIVPLKTGALSFPRMEVIRVGSKHDPDYTDAFRVYVLSVLAEGDTLLRDIKPLESYPMQLPFWVYLLLLLAAIGMGAYLILNRPRKQKKGIQKAEIPREIIPIPAWKQSLAALEALQANPLINSYYNAKAALDELLVAEKEWLPLFKETIAKLENGEDPL